MSDLAVVLGGGGSAGVAWEVGVLHGLAEGGADLRSADLFVGTSAGSIVATLLLSGAGTRELYDAACAAAAEAPVDVDYAALEARWAEVTRGATSAADARRRIGDLARAADTMPPEQRRREIAARMGMLDWPERRLLVTAVDAADGRFATFDRDTADLLDAVSASCAVPGLWPPVEVGGRTYVDGAVRSTVNVDLAAGSGLVVVLAPMPPIGGIARELDRLPAGTRSHVVESDAQALASFGSNPLDPGTGPGAAREGYRQGQQSAPAVAALLAGR